MPAANANQASSGKRRACSTSAIEKDSIALIQSCTIRPRVASNEEYLAKKTVKPIKIKMLSMMPLQSLCPYEFWLSITYLEVVFQAKKLHSSS